MDSAKECPRPTGGEYLHREGPKAGKNSQYPTNTQTRNNFQGFGNTVNLILTF